MLKGCDERRGDEKRCDEKRYDQKDVLICALLGCVTREY